MSVQIDEFSVALSEKQFPMFVRLCQLFAALYYGNLKEDLGQLEDSTPEAERNLYVAKHNQDGDVGDILANPAEG